MNFAKVIFVITAFILSNDGFAQESKEDKRLLDSLIANDEFLQFLNALDGEKSNLTISIAASNRLASVNNNSINALQGNSKAIITPGITYTHKSGLGISASAYILNYDGKTGLHRLSITPFFQYTTSKVFSLALSYTRFFADDQYNAVASPVQNDFYINTLYKKSFIEPGISIGFSTGKYKEIDAISINLPGRGRTTINDTAITSLQSLSVTGSAEHQFLLHQKIAKRSAILFTPSLLINAGNNSFNVQHKNNFAGVVRGRGRRQLFRNQSASSSFDIQSAGINLYVNYSIYKFSIQPQLYLDYYLPSTTEDRFTQLYNVSIEYSF